MARLRKFSIRGFRTIRELEDFELRPLNVLIGANGAGKSNLIAFFRLLNSMMSGSGNLQFHVGELGWANSILHDGAARTPHLVAQFEFENETGLVEYAFRLAHAAENRLIFAEERYRVSATDSTTAPEWESLGAGHGESKILALAHTDPTCRFIRDLLRRCVVYQFHNTSSSARLRQHWDVEDGRYLKEDAGNLAAFLLALRNEYPRYYRRLVSTLQSDLPFFADFSLEPANKQVLLRWHERDTDMIFGSHQASDGMLRLMALMSLLLQPTEKMPTLIVLDEPELGLHPHAIVNVGGHLRAASRHVQVLLATQSLPLVDAFDPEDLVVVDRRGRVSEFHRLDSERLEEWLQAYSLSELWEKNVLGGRPG